MFEDLEPFSVTITVETQNSIVNQASITAPAIMLKDQFMDLVNQVSQKRSPYKVEMSRIVNVWNPFDQGFIKKTLFVRFMNNAYLAWMDEQKGNTNEV